MISFRQFLDEAILSKRQALRKLALTSKPLEHLDDDEVKRRDRKQISTEPYLRQKHPDGAISLKAGIRDMWTANPSDKIREKIGKKIKRIPLDKVTTGQTAVSKHAVAQKITGAFRKHEKEVPRFPIFTKGNDGSYELRDGNHRTIARKVRGFTHIRGIVVDKDD